MHVHGCIHVCVCVCVCMHAWVYEHLATCAWGCIHVCVCMHVCVYIFPPTPPSIEVGLAGFTPPPSNIAKLPMPMIRNVIIDRGLV